MENLETRQEKKEIIISNPEKLEATKKAIADAGAEKLHVLADFDRTLTAVFLRGESVPPLMAVLRDGGYLTHEYAEKAEVLFKKYHPIEVDQSIPFEEKKVAMDKWWREHFDLLIESGLKKGDLEEVIASGKVKLRDGFAEFADLLNARKIPLVIMSSNGLGTESVALYLKQVGKLSDNVHIICNEYEWDAEGRAVGVREPIIHALNKYETAIQDFPAFDVVKERKNVIVLGDGLDDVGMVQGFEYDNLITVGFLNDKVEENKERYQKAFDVVLTGDASMEYINNFLKEVVR
ncbi:MAG: hypothetical protein AAB497_02910 [Patescibacteria group bacterium]